MLKGVSSNGSGTVGGYMSGVCPDAERAAIRSSMNDVIFCFIALLFFLFLFSLILRGLGLAEGGFYLFLRERRL